MKRFFPLLFLLTAALSVQAQVSTRAVDGLRTKPIRLIAITNCTVIPEPGKRIDSAVIIIRDERIEAVGRKLSIPQGAEVRDSRGMWVYAGFVDPYLDVAAVGEGKSEAKDRPWWEDEGPETPTAVGIRHWNQAVHPEVRASTMINVGDDAATQLQKLGITAGAAGSLDGIFRGTSAAILVRPGTASMTVIADNVYQGMSFRKGTSRTPYPSSMMGCIALIRQTLSDATWYVNAHAVAKRNASLTPPETNIALEALAANSQLPFMAEAQDEHDIMRWNEIFRGTTTIPHIIKGSGFEYRRLASMAALKPNIVLPLAFPTTPDVRDVTGAGEVALVDLIHWYWAADNARLLDSVGCTIAFTTHGLKDKSSFLDNVRLCVARGMDSSHALAALTTTAAKFAGIADRCGRIAPGYYANLVFASGDIFDGKTSINAVMVAGRTTEVKRQADIDMRGVWTMTSNAVSRNLTVRITGSPTAPGVAVKADSITVPSTFVINGQRLHFTLQLDTLGIKGIARGAALADSILVSGVLTAPDGANVPFVLRRDSLIPRTPDVRPPVTERRALPTWLPLGPFGMDSLPAQNTVVLKNATVWTCGPDGVRQNTDVVISGGRITAIGSGAGAGATTIDCTGMHVTPGIIDEHSHIAISRGVNEGTHAVTTEVRIGDVLDPDDINIYRQLAGGVTASHLLHGSANPMGGQLQFIKLRWSADAEGLKVNDVPGTVKFALGENVKQSNWGDRFTVRYPQSRMGVEQLMRDAFRAAREYEQDLKSTDPGKLPVRRDIQLDALVEILNGSRKIHCHSYVQSEILMLMRLAEEFGFRVHTFTHILEGYKVAREMAKHGASASSFADWWAYKFEVFDAIPESPAIMHEQGVLVSINSDDAEMARRLNQEAAKSVKYGNVNPEEAMRFPTINAAKQMVADRRMGSLETGKDADVVVWSGNPLSNMSRVERTYVDGREMFSRTQDAHMRERDAELRRFLEQEALKSIASGGAVAGRGTGPRRMYHCDDMEDEGGAEHTER